MSSEDSHLHELNRVHSKSGATKPTSARFVRPKDDSWKNPEISEKLESLTRSRRVLRKRGLRGTKKSCDEAPSERVLTAARNHPSVSTSSTRLWTLKEKRRLLEGLRSYGPQNSELITNLVVTKSEAQVKDKILSLRRSADNDGQISGGVVTDDGAPIEKWIYSISELLNCEDTDWSEQICKALGYIAKHEEFAEGQTSDLSWKNIYRFLYAIAEGQNAELPNLSDIESLILLELMADLGKTLQKSNTSRQRQVLEHKFQMINAGVGLNYRVDIPQRTYFISLLTRALANDFTGLEDLLVGSESTQSQSSTSRGASSSTSGDGPDVSSNTGAAPPVSSLQKHSGAKGKLVPRDSVDLGEHVIVKNPASHENTFVRPKYFTLNPLCITTELLHFEPDS